MKKKHKLLRLALRGIYHPSNLISIGLEEEVEYVIQPKLQHFKSDQDAKQTRKELDSTLKELKELEISMLRILEKCDALNPSELMSVEDDSADFFILPGLVDNRANDEVFIEIMEGASLSFRKNRAVLVGRVNGGLKELDMVAKRIGLEL